MNICEELESVTGPDGFIEFVHRLTKDLEQNSANWANVTLKDYLLSIASWVEDGVHERDEEAGRGATVRKGDAEWQRLAFLLFAAGRYE